MGRVTNVLLCSFVAVIAQAQVTLNADRPFLWVQDSHSAVLECCYTNIGKLKNSIWVRYFQEDKQNIGPVNVNKTDRVIPDVDSNKSCGVLKFLNVQKNDSGMYKCWLKEGELFTHGTYLHVYQRLEKTINLNESTKNKILVAEGVLLLLCVILPSFTLILQSKKLNELENKKMKMQEENIYQGLNLEDCCTTYDQIERSQTQGQYQDVYNDVEQGEEEIQLEKP